MELLWLSCPYMNIIAQIARGYEKSHKISYKYLKNNKNPYKELCMREYSERSQEELTLKERIELLAEEKRDNDRLLSNKKQAKQMGINYNTFRKYITEQKDTTQCSISNLAKIANYYNVSTDYLLGRTDSKSIDNKVQATREVTGLSDDAIKKLSELHKENRRLSYSDILSIILEFGNIDYLLSLIGAKISYHATKRGLKDFDLVKNMIERTIHLDIDGLNLTAYKDNLIEAMLQSEFQNSLRMVYDEYILRYSKTPAECEREYEEYEKSLVAKLKKGEITHEQFTNLIKQYLNGGADNGKHQGKQE